VRRIGMLGSDGKDLFLAPVCSTLLNTHRRSGPPKLTTSSIDKVISEGTLPHEAILTRCSQMLLSPWSQRLRLVAEPDSRDFARRRPQTWLGVENGKPTNPRKGFSTPKCSIPPAKARADGLRKKAFLNPKDSQARNI
jgi:hypothetical protein